MSAIYVLEDAEGATCYVGRTARPESRARDHARRWPELTMRVVAYVPDEQAPWVEAEAIRSAEEAGYPLRNIAGVAVPLELTFAGPRQVNTSLRPAVYDRLKELADRERRTMGAQVAVLLDMADAQRPK